MATLNLPQSMAVGTVAQNMTPRELPMAESSWIQNMRYEPATFQLIVTTKKGAQYIHFYTFPMTFDQIMQSPSKGKTYSAMLRNGTLSKAFKSIHHQSGPALRHLEKGPVKHDRRRPV